MKIILWIAGAVCGMILGVMAGAALTVARIRRRINKNSHFMHNWLLTDIG